MSDFRLGYRNIILNRNEKGFSGKLGMMALLIRRVDNKRPGVRAARLHPRSFAYKEKEQAKAP